MNSKLQTTQAKVYLTGFMGSGKSTVGPLVAERLGWHFLDLDDVITERAGRPIPAIFAEEGEGGFRQREAEALRAAGEEAQTVVATGGGTLVQEENLRHALRTGLVVYLRASPAVLAERLRSAAAERPLLQGTAGQPLTGAALTQRIETLLAERRRFYERAHATVDAARVQPKETAEAVVEVVRSRRRLPSAQESRKERR